ncbi:MAG: adenosylcobinamide-GDP ribazoletransferase [Novosphingobium sp.]
MIADAWRLSVGTLTALPVGPPAAVDRRRAGTAMLLAPLAVVPLAAPLGVVLWGAHLLDLPPLVGALLAVGAVVLGDRAFHLDGLSDVADGLAASYDRERSLAVMKSGTSGPAGVVATVLVLGLQVAGLAGSVADWHRAILAGAVLCASRVALSWCCLRGVPTARPDGLGASFAGSVGRTAAMATWLASTIVLAALTAWVGIGWWRGPLALVVATVLVGLLVRRAVARFGGAGAWRFRPPRPSHLSSLSRSDGEGDRPSSGWWRGKKTPPSALRAATSPFLRNRED